MLTSSGGVQRITEDMMLHVQRIDVRFQSLTAVEGYSTSLTHCVWTDIESTSDFKSLTAVEGNSILRTVPAQTWPSKSGMIIQDVWDHLTYARQRSLLILEFKSGLQHYKNCSSMSTTNTSLQTLKVQPGGKARASSAHFDRFHCLVCEDTTGEVRMQCSSLCRTLQSPLCVDTKIKTRIESDSLFRMLLLCKCENGDAFQI